MNFDPCSWELSDGGSRVVDYIASNGDRYFSIDDFWVVISAEGVMRIEPRGEVQ